MFSICLQMVMVHLVNYATDLNINSLTAATFMSVVGVSSIVGRLVMGTTSDRIGSISTLTICCSALLVSVVWLVFTSEVWMFYAFAVIFGFAYGGEITQMAALVGYFFGLKMVTTLVGVVTIGTCIGGAIGSWLGGILFDMTQSYQIAFIVAAVAVLFALILTVVLKRFGSVKLPASLSG
jgi:MFS family permease